jgi:hypothetical protein
MLRAASTWLLIAASLSMAAVFALAFYLRYWRWRDCFNELGRCYDPIEGVVYLEQSGAIWGGLAFISASIALALWLSRRKRRF